MKFKKVFYQTKNAIKYFFKENVTVKELEKCKSLVEGGYMSESTYEGILKREDKKYKVGDVVELIYEGVLGNGEIVKIKEGFFGNKYLISTVVTTTYFLKHEVKSRQVLEVNEDDILRVLMRDCDD